MNTGDRVTVISTGKTGVLRSYHLGQLDEPNLRRDLQPWTGWRHYVRDSANQIIYVANHTAGLRPAFSGT